MLEGPKSEGDLIKNARMQSSSSREEDTQRGKTISINTLDKSVKSGVLIYSLNPNKKYTLVKEQDLYDVDSNFTLNGNQFFCFNSFIIACDKTTLKLDYDDLSCD